MKKIVLFCFLIALTMISCNRNEVIPTTSSFKQTVNVPAQYNPTSANMLTLYSFLWYDGTYYVEFTPSGRINEYYFYPLDCRSSINDIDSFSIINDDSVKYYSSFGNSSYTTYRITFSGNILTMSGYDSYSPRILTRTTFRSMDEKSSDCLGKFKSINIDTLVNNLWFDPNSDYYVEFKSNGSMTEYNFLSSICGYSLYDTDSIVFVGSDSIYYYSTPGYYSPSARYKIAFSGDSLMMSQSSYSNPWTLVRTPYKTIAEKKIACSARFKPIAMDTLVKSLWLDNSSGYYVAFDNSGLTTDYSFSSSTCSFYNYDEDSVVLKGNDSMYFYQDPGYSYSLTRYTVKFVGDSLTLSDGYYSYRTYVRTPYSTIQARTSACVSSSSLDSFEPDNTYSQASTVNVGSTTAEHSLHTSSDYDYFKVVIPSSGYYTFQTNSSYDLYMTLYSTNGTSVLESDDDDGVGSNPLIRYYFSASGTYYVMVRPYSSSTGTYTLSVSQN